MRFSLLLLSVVLLSCSDNRFSYRDISEFNIDTSVLHNGDSVEIIYSSGGPMKELQKEYLFHTIVVSLKTNDTINLLSSNISEVVLGGRNLQFMDPYNPMNRVHGHPEIKNIKELENIPIEFPKKVIRNNEHLEFDFKRYPAIIGSLGHVYHKELWEKYGY